MAGHALKKKGFLYNRLRLHAKKLKTFTTKELAEKINTMPAVVSNNGEPNSKLYSNKSSKLQVTSNRLSSMLIIEPLVKKKTDRIKTKGIQIWEWVGDEE